jgi:GT2 family glycosyltransferase
MKLTIVLPCLNGVELSELSLDALYDSKLPTETELILVDDGSTDDTPKLDKLYPNITTVIRHRRNMGFSVSCNEAIKISSGEYIAIFNNDLIVPKNWFTSAELSISDENIVYSRPTYHKLGMVSLNMISPGSNFFNIKSNIDFENYKHNYAYNTTPLHCKLLPFHTGGPWIIKREVFNDVGYFDERFYPALWEDIDLFARMVINNWVFASLEGCYSFHFHSQTMSKFPNIGDIYTGNRNLFTEKWDLSLNENEIPDIDWEASLNARKIIVLNSIENG